MIKNMKWFAAGLWLALISLLYYQSFPFTDLVNGLPTLPAVQWKLLPLGTLLLLALVTGASAGWGSFVVRSTALSELEAFLFAEAAGLGFLSLLTFLLAVAGFLGPLPLYLFVGGGLVLLFFKGGKPGALSRNLTLLLLLSLLPLVSALIGALAPPTQFDSLVYHLALPSHYIAAGTMTAVPYNIFFSFPQNGEMLFLSGMLLRGDVLANLFSWLFLLLTALAVYALARRYINVRAGIVAGLLWLFMPEALFLATGTYVDLVLTFYTLLALYAFLLRVETGEDRWLVLSALLMGFSVGIKYTAAVGIPAMLLLLAVFEPKARKLRSCLLFGVVSVVPVLPWLIKNWVFLKNPIAPWGASLFTHSIVTAEQARYYFEHIAGHGAPVRNLLDLLLLPWTMTVEGYRFGGAFDSIGPLFLLFVPALFLRHKIDTITKVILLFAAVYLAAWFSTGKVLRFLLPLFPLFAILAAEGFMALAQRAWLRWIAAAVLLAGLANNLLFFHWTMAPIDPYAPALGGMSRDEYLLRKVNYYPAATRSINALPEGTKTLFWGETRSYYCSARVLVPTVFDPNPLPAAANAATSTGELSGRLHAGGITHLFVNEFELQRLKLDNEFTQKGRENWEGLKKASRLIYHDRYGYVYELPHER